ncbi:hypothetical protein DVH24_041287 [Malus domestica]|uniref:Uncharacterized protein n=1 Tax=Malus domestica TaxID=3750 RepID=A0A498IAD9_MALDO|nr:hypothetical protein DVH24_041287 [Malus domestica]
MDKVELELYRSNRATEETRSWCSQKEHWLISSINPIPCDVIFLVAGDKINGAARNYGGVPHRLSEEVGELRCGIKTKAQHYNKHTFLGLLAKIKCREGFTTIACYWSSCVSPKRCTIAWAWHTPPNRSSNFDGPPK